MKQEKGFTMIELVMVIVIIGILAAIAIPRFIDLRNNASRAACRQSAGALRAAIANFYASTVMNSPGDQTPWPATLTNAVLSPYIQSWPANPVSAASWAAVYNSGTGILSMIDACSNLP